MEIVKYNINEAEIAKMSDIYMHLAIKDIDDKEGIESVHSARMVMVKHRNAVNKLRKSANEDAQAYIKNNNSNAKKLLALMEPIETHLKNEEEVITNEIKRIEAEKEALEKKRTQDRVDELFTVGVVLPYFDVAMMTDEIYDEMFEAAAKKNHIEQLRLEEEKKAKETEEKRLADDRAEIEKVKKEQETKAKEQEEKEKALQAERDKIEADKKAEEDRKNRETFEKKVAEDAKIQAEKDAKEKAERETRELKEKEEREVAEKRRLEFLKPDKEKLLAWIESFNQTNNPTPQLQSKEALGILNAGLDGIETALQRIQNQVEGM
jgi:hypothetical protein